MRQRAASLLVTLSLVIAPSALAQGPTASDAARGHFEAGARAYDIGDYDLAMREFRAAYAASHHPDLLYNIYAAAERLGALEEARDALRGFLSDAEVASDQRTSLEARLARLEARIEAGVTEPSTAAPPVAPVAPTPPEPPGARATPASIALLSVSGSFLVGFGVFAALSEVEDRSLDDRCGVACTDDEVVRLRVFNGLADASLAAAVGAGAVGLTLLLIHRRDREEVRTAPAVAVAPLLDRHVGGLALEGRF